ncbi:MAG: DUF2254 domain-containing protein [Proteobacteria bacterium]|nr:DUF2254 domain-containing protein [Pseudomonadota bacterium]
MNGTGYRRGQSRAWMYAFVSITAASVAVYLSTYFIDAANHPGISLKNLFFGAHVHDALTNMPEVIAGVLGITITVVAIIVELASNRYTPRVTDLFVKSPTNLAVLGFFVVTGLMCIWISLTGAYEGYTPVIGTTVTVFAITACMLILLPYFAFVFSFLNPHHIVERMGHSTLKAIRKYRREKRAPLQRNKLLAVGGIEQLADVALNAIEHKDKGICKHAVDNLGELSRNYLEIKNTMPDRWFLLDKELRENPDFVSMQEEVLEDIENGRFWFEMKVLRQFQMLYGETLNRMRDINYLIAINTRKLAEKAMNLDHDVTTTLVVKFFNTFLRATINGRDVRTAYNVLNQYRRLAEIALEKGRYDVAVEAARRFKYYGQLGFASGLPFVLETAAYDLCTLNEFAFDLEASCKDEILHIFLEVDKEAEEGHEFEASLRGVRKAQVKLATYYLTHGAEELARIIFEDMQGELPARLASIREELAGITSKDFWEISDRGGNFDYLEPDRRAQLDKFFSWFSFDKKDVSANGRID